MVNGEILLVLVLHSYWSTSGVQSQCTSGWGCSGVPSQNTLTPSYRDTLLYTLQGGINSKIHHASAEVKESILEAKEEIKDDLRRLEEELLSDINQSKDHLLMLTRQLEDIKQTLNQLTEAGSGSNHASRDTSHLPYDCSDISSERSGVFTIYLRVNGEPVPTEVYCDMHTHPGGWTVFQRRASGSVNFNRSWTEYRNGFGSPDGDFWLGNQILNLLTAGRNQMLRVDLKDFENRSAYAEFSMFSIGSECERFQLTVGNYTGNAGDSLSYHNGAVFSAPDRDNDDYPDSCALEFQSGWWFRRCSSSDLNAPYWNENEHIRPTTDHGVNWETFRGIRYSLALSEMKIRRI